MPEYIEREALLSELQEEIEFETSMYTEEQNKYFNMGLKCAIRDVKSQPAADVTEVRHGEWVQIGYDEALDRITCSCCKEYFNLIDNCTEAFNYCPNCGEVPTIGYACGEYFILPTSKAIGTCVCSSFTEMHASKEQEIEAWNRRAENVKSD